MQTVIDLPAPGACLQLLPNFLTSSEHRTLFHQLLEQPHWQQDQITLFGQVHNLPRLQAWYGDKFCHYSYSGIQLKPRPWNDSLLALKHKIETQAQSTFNCVLLNLYRSGQDSNGWHADDEAELGEQPVIASLSLGATRRFKLRHKYLKELRPISLDLQAGSLLLMKGRTQDNWQHCLPKTALAVEPRINLTFRQIIHGPC